MCGDQTVNAILCVALDFNEGQFAGHLVAAEYRHAVLENRSGIDVLAVGADFNRLGTVEPLDSTHTVLVACDEVRIGIDLGKCLHPVGLIHLRHDVAARVQAGKRVVAGRIG